MSTIHKSNRILLMRGLDLLAKASRVRGMIYSAVVVVHVTAASVSLAAGR